MNINRFSTTSLSNIHNVYELKKFSPTIINKKYLSDLGVDIDTDELTLKKLEKGSRQFLNIWDEGKLYPPSVFNVRNLDMDSKLVEQTYTGVCPSHVFRLDPAYGCSFGCLYCLDIHEDYNRDILVYKNYSDFVKKQLEKNESMELSYYLSAVTDVFQEPVLQTGVIHKILKEFAAHYKKHCDSTQKLFISTKGGLEHLNYRYNGDSVLDLLKELPAEKVQFNVSVGIMADYLFDIFEPNSASIIDRLEALKVCRELGIYAKSVLCQPIFSPYVCDSSIKEYFDLLSSYGASNFKPEFATLSVESLSILGQIIGFFNKEKEKQLYEHYIGIDNKSNQKGTSGRIAPQIDISRKMLLELYQVGKEHSMSMTICNWIRLKNNIVREIPILEEKRRFPCL